MNENNELRCTAHAIILMLLKQKELGQIQLLYMACALSIKSLDPAAWRETVERANAALTPTKEAWWDSLSDEKQVEIMGRIGQGITPNRVFSKPESDK